MRWIPLVVALLSPVVAAAEDSRQRVIVSDMKAEALGLGGQARTLTEVLLSDLAQDSRYEVLGASDLNALLANERQRQLIGCSESAACLAEIGGALNAPFLLESSLGQVGDRYVLNLKWLDTRTAKVMYRFSEEVTGGQEGLVDAVHRAVGLMAPPERGGIRVTRTTVIAGSVAAVALAAGVAVGALALSTASQRDAATTPAEYDALRTRARTYSYSSTGAYAVAGICAVGAVITLFNAR
jgi:hypothetical protein